MKKKPIFYKCDEYLLTFKHRSARNQHKKKAHMGEYKLVLKEDPISLSSDGISTLHRAELSDTFDENLNKKPVKT